MEKGALTDTDTDTDTDTQDHALHSHSSSDAPTATTPKHTNPQNTQNTHVPGHITPNQERTLVRHSHARVAAARQLPHTTMGESRQGNRLRARVIVACSELTPGTAAPGPHTAILHHS